MIANKLASVGLRASRSFQSLRHFAKRQATEIKQACFGLASCFVGDWKQAFIPLLLYFLPQSREGLESLPSLRGDVNKVDKGELLTLKIKNLELKMKSTPPPLRGTSPQSMEGLESLPSLRGDVNKVDKGELLK